MEEGCEVGEEGGEEREGTVDVESVGGGKVGSFRVGVGVDAFECSCCCLFLWIFLFFG